MSEAPKEWPPVCRVESMMALGAGRVRLSLIQVRPDVDDRDGAVRLVYAVDAVNVPPMDAEFVLDRRES